LKVQDKKMPDQSLPEAQEEMLFCEGAVLSANLGAEGWGLATVTGVNTEWDLSKGVISWVDKSLSTKKKKKNKKQVFPYLVRSHETGKSYFLKESNDAWCKQLVSEEQSKFEMNEPCFVSCANLPEGNSTIVPSKTPWVRGVVSKLWPFLGNLGQNSDLSHKTARYIVSCPTLENKVPIFGNSIDVIRKIPTSIFEAISRSVASHDTFHEISFFVHNTTHAKDLNLSSKDGDVLFRKYLHDTAVFGNFDALQWLMVGLKGAHVHDSDENTMETLGHSVDANKLLLADSRNRTILHIACVHDKLDYIVSILERYGKPHAWDFNNPVRRMMYTEDSLGCNLFHYAVAKLNTSLMEILLDIQLTRAWGAAEKSVVTTFNPCFYAQSTWKGNFFKLIEMIYGLPFIRMYLSKEDEGTLAQVSAFDALTKLNNILSRPAPGASLEKEKEKLSHLCSTVRRHEAELLLGDMIKGSIVSAEASVGLPSVSLDFASKGCWQAFDPEPKKAFSLFLKESIFARRLVRRLLFYTALHGLDRSFHTLLSSCCPDGELECLSIESCEPTVPLDMVVDTEPSRGTSQDALIVVELAAAALEPCLPSADYYPNFPADCSSAEEHNGTSDALIWRFWTQHRQMSSLEPKVSGRLPMESSSGAIAATEADAPRAAPRMTEERLNIVNALHGINLCGYAKGQIPLAMVLCRGDWTLFEQWATFYAEEISLDTMPYSTFIDKSGPWSWLAWGIQDLLQSCTSDVNTLCLPLPQDSFDGRFDQVSRPLTLLDVLLLLTTYHGANELLEGLLSLPCFSRDKMALPCFGTPLESEVHHLPRIAVPWPGQTAESIAPTCLTLLHIALLGGHADCVEILLECHSLTDGGTSPIWQIDTLMATYGPKRVPPLLFAWRLGVPSVVQTLRNFLREQELAGHLPAAFFSNQYWDIDGCGETLYARESGKSTHKQHQQHRLKALWAREQEIKTYFGDLHFLLETNLEECKSDVSDRVHIDVSSIIPSFLDAISHPSILKSIRSFTYAQREAGAMNDWAGFQNFVSNVANMDVLGEVCFFSRTDSGFLGIDNQPLSCTIAGAFWKLMVVAAKCGSTLVARAIADLVRQINDEQDRDKHGRDLLPIPNHSADEPAKMQIQDGDNEDHGDQSSEDAHHHDLLTHFLKLMYLLLDGTKDQLVTSSPQSSGLSLTRVSLDFVSAELQEYTELAFDMRVLCSELKKRVMECGASVKQLENVLSRQKSFLSSLPDYMDGESMGWSYLSLFDNVNCPLPMKCSNATSENLEFFRQLLPASQQQTTDVLSHLTVFDRLATITSFKCLEWILSKMVPERAYGVCKQAMFYALLVVEEGKKELAHFLGNQLLRIARRIKKQGKSCDPRPIFVSALIVAAKYVPAQELFPQFPDDPSDEVTQNSESWARLNDFWLRKKEIMADLLDLCEQGTSSVGMDFNSLGCHDPSTHFQNILHAAMECYQRRPPPCVQEEIYFKSYMLPSGRAPGQFIDWVLDVFCKSGRLDLNAPTRRGNCANGDLVTCFVDTAASWLDDQKITRDVELFYFRTLTRIVELSEGNVAMHEAGIMEYFAEMVNRRRKVLRDATNIQCHCNPKDQGNCVCCQHTYLNIVIKKLPEMHINIANMNFLHLPLSPKRCAKAGKCLDLEKGKQRLIWDFFEAIGTGQSVDTLKGKMRSAISALYMMSWASKTKRKTLDFESVPNIAATHLVDNQLRGVLHFAAIADRADILDWLSGDGNYNESRLSVYPQQGLRGHRVEWARLFPEWSDVSSEAESVDLDASASLALAREESDSRIAGNDIICAMVAHQLAKEEPDRYPFQKKKRQWRAVLCDKGGRDKGSCIPHWRALDPLRKDAHGYSCVQLATKFASPETAAAARRIAAPFIIRNGLARIVRRRRVARVTRGLNAASVTISRMMRGFVIRRRITPMLGGTSGKIEKFRARWSDLLSIVTRANRERIHDSGVKSEFLYFSWHSEKEKSGAIVVPSDQTSDSTGVDSILHVSLEDELAMRNDLNEVLREEKEQHPELRCMPLFSQFSEKYEELKQRLIAEGKIVDDEDETNAEEESSSSSFPSADEKDIIEFTAEVRKWRDKADSKLLEMFSKTVELLGSGRRSYALAKPLVGCKTPIYEAKLTSGMRILWTPVQRDQFHNSKQKCLLIHNVVKHDDISTYARQIDGAISRMRTCPPMLEYSCLPTASDTETKVEKTEKGLLLNDESVLIDPMSNRPLKTYLTPRPKWSELMNKQFKPPLRLSKKEEEIVNEQNSLLVYGRSGTGKTVCICNKMQVDRHFDGSQNVGITKQIFIARSRKLVNLVQRTNERNSAGSVQDLKYMKCIVFEDFLLDMEEAILTSSKSAKALFAFTREDQRRVTWKRFQEVLWPRMKVERQKRSSKLQITLEPLVVYTQIRTHIKGSLEAVCAMKPIELEDYLEFATKRCRLTKEQRIETYELYRIYAAFLEEEGRWDDNDRALDIIEAAKWDDGTRINWNRFGGGMGGAWDRVYVDEIQDNTQAEIALFMLVGGLRGNNLMLAGDMAQSVVEGIEFRFEEVRTLLHTFSAGGSMDKSELLARSSIGREMSARKPSLLKVNYRSHAGVLDVASKVLEVLFSHFPGAAKTLPKDKGLLRGPRPLFYHVSQDTALSILASNQSYVTLVVDADREAELTRMQPDENDKSTVLTIRDAKGLEFPNVIIYNFFSHLLGANREQHKSWVGMLSRSTDAHSVDPQFQYQHPELEGHIKLLYTAITRCCSQLVFVEVKSNANNAGERFFRFLVEGELGHKQTYDAHGRKEVVSPDDLISLGIDLLLGEKETKHLEKAIPVFKSAGATDLKEKAEAELRAITFLPKALAELKLKQSGGGKSSLERTLSKFQSTWLTTAKEVEFRSLLIALISTGMWDTAAELCGEVIPYLEDGPNVRKYLLEPLRREGSRRAVL
jgi:hypothetical protein